MKRGTGGCGEAASPIYTFKKSGFHNEGKSVVMFLLSNTIFAELPDFKKTFKKMTFCKDFRKLEIKLQTEP